MEASSSVRKRIGGNWPRGDLFSNRRNTLAVAIAAALIAGVLLYVFVRQYKKSVNNSSANTPVLVATGLIPRGTASSEVASVGLYRPTLVRSKQAAAGAITDSAALQGTYATTTIYPGQQLTAADFSRSPVSIASELTRTDRAIAMPIDGTHGLVGFVSDGDHVDVLSSVGGKVVMLAPDVLVLSAPNGGSNSTIGSTNSGGNIVLRVSQDQVLAMAQAADTGKIWIVMRPAADAISPATSSTPASGGSTATTTTGTPR
jgi:Flp pilus assembly protein CpaB